MTQPHLCDMHNTPLLDEACFTCLGVAPETLKKPDEWQKLLPNVLIVDSDGWSNYARYGLPAKDWDVPITLTEYIARRGWCTCDWSGR